MSRLPSPLVVIALLATTPAARADPAFPLGVASGDVLADRAICWTRTIGPGDVRVEIARDDAFTDTITTAVLSASADAGFALKFEATSLAPATHYFFRFTRLDSSEISPTGAFLTAPPPDAQQSFRFVYSGDAAAGRLPFRLLDFAADENPDLWFFAGDTIYGDQTAGGLGPATDLEGYRAKYAQNRADPSLQRLSSAAAVWTQWDDHEVTNDYDGGDAEPGITPQQIADAYQAFFENQPIRDQAVPGDARRIYRSFPYGTLAEFFILDCRQYRSRDAGRDGGGADPYGILTNQPEPDTIARLQDPSRTMLGAAQLAWLKAGLSASAARWKFVLSSVTFTSLLAEPYDRWDGYDAERLDLLRFIDGSGIDGVVILSADIHGNLFNPDVTYFLRNSLRESFSPGFRVPELVAGPIAQSSLRQELSNVAPSINDIPSVVRDNPTLRELLIDWAETQVQSRNRLAFVEPNRYAYLVVDVAPSGLTLTHKGIPADSADTTTPLATLHTARLPEPAMCGIMPANALMGFVVVGFAFAAGGSRRRHFGSLAGSRIDTISSRSRVLV